MPKNSRNNLSKNIHPLCIGLNRREFLIDVGGVLFWILAGCPVFANESKNNFIHMMNYVLVEDFPLMEKLHINTVLVELDKDGKNWHMVYQSALRHGLKIVPLIWGKDQSILEWNTMNAEWELDYLRYPKSSGAKFIRFLMENPAYRNQTLAVYSFHEPLANPKQTGPERLKKFYEQITQEIFKGEEMRVYGEDMTFVWPQAEECLTGVLDYEVYTVYPFARSKGRHYRPFLPQGYYGEPTSDLGKVLDLHLQTIERQLDNIRNAEPAKTGRKPRIIVILQAFQDPVSEKGLWNRMPDAIEMFEVASFLVKSFGNKLAGIAWYSFRQAATHYSKWLHKDRFDNRGKDRWRVIAEIGKMLL